jgi:hypothetical protein
MEDLMKFLDLPEDLYDTAHDDTTRHETPHTGLMLTVCCVRGLPFNVIVREWSDMRPEMEFRVFVKNKQITAISQ